MEKVCFVLLVFFSYNNNDFPSVISLENGDV